MIKTSNNSINKNNTYNTNHNSRNSNTKNDANNNSIRNTSIIAIIFRFDSIRSNESLPRELL